MQGEGSSQPWLTGTAQLPALGTSGAPIPSSLKGWHTGVWVSLSVLMGAAVVAVPSVRTCLPSVPGLPGNHSPQGCLQLSWGITWPTASFCLVPVSPHLPDGIKELKQSHHSVSCHHDAQHLHRHTIRQKKIFSLISDFPSPKPSCISRLTHLTAHTSPLCCSALPKAMARLDPQSQGWTALPELPLSFLLGWDWWWLRVREMLSLSNLYWKQVSDHCIWVLQSRSTFPTK